MTGLVLVDGRVGAVEVDAVAFQADVLADLDGVVEEVRILHQN